jgi:hypothetical protein
VRLTDNENDAPAEAGEGDDAPGPAPTQPAPTAQFVKVVHEYIAQKEEELTLKEVRIFASLPRTPSSIFCKTAALWPSDVIFSFPFHYSRTSNPTCLCVFPNCRYVFVRAYEILMLDAPQGEILVVVEKDDSGWWKGQLGNESGWFPPEFVQEITEEEVQSFIESTQSSTKGKVRDFAPYGLLVGATTAVYSVIFGFLMACRMKNSHERRRRSCKPK